MPAESALRDRGGTGFELIETLRWQREIDFVRLDRHLARLYASASELGFACDPDVVGAALGEAVGAALNGSDVLRVRLALAANGDVSCKAQPFAPLPASDAWKLRVARTRLDSSNQLLRHKTSGRETYEAARAEFTHDQADEVLLLNERDELCEGTITTLFIDFGDGLMRTPALSCGLLAGVLRAEMLETGQATEAIIRMQDLDRAKAIFVGNSLRGLIKCAL